MDNKTGGEKIETLSNGNQINNETVYYNLYHIYENEENEIDKFIGVYNSKERINEVINILTLQDGFKEYPRECFEVHECIINLCGWENGFTSLIKNIDIE